MLPLVWRGVYEFGVGPGTASYTINYLRAEAYLHAKDGARASAEYQRILARQGVKRDQRDLQSLPLRLGRAYVLQDNTASAKSAYQDFFAAWKDADPDVPILKEAKAEYQKLQ
jgi:hypothetical protein